MSAPLVISVAPPTPMAMMIIGSSLAHSDIRAAFSNPRLYRVSLLRLIVMHIIPLLMAAAEIEAYVTPQLLKLFL